MSLLRHAPLYDMRDPQRVANQRQGIRDGLRGVSSQRGVVAEQARCKTPGCKPGAFCSPRCESRHAILLELRGGAA